MSGSFPDHQQQEDEEGYQMSPEHYQPLPIVRGAFFTWILVCVCDCCFKRDSCLRHFTCAQNYISVSQTVYVYGEKETFEPKNGAAEELFWPKQNDPETKIRKLQIS